MEATSVGILSALSSWGTLDPYWEFQQLVEYSKDLHTCMDSVELEQQYHSKGELNQPSLEGESRSMHHSIDRRRIIGEEHALNTCILYSNFMHYYTMFL